MFIISSRARLQTSIKRKWVSVDKEISLMRVTYVIASLDPVIVQVRSGSPALSGAIWILAPDSAWRREICSPPLPITKTWQRRKKTMLDLLWLSLVVRCQALLSPTILSGTATSSVLTGPRPPIIPAGMFIMRPCIPPGDLKAPKGSEFAAAAAAAAAATAAAILLESGSFSIGGLKLQNGRFTVVMLVSFLSKFSEGLPGPGWILDASCRCTC